MGIVSTIWRWATAAHAAHAAGHAAGTPLLLLGLVGHHALLTAAAGPTAGAAPAADVAPAAPEGEDILHSQALETLRDPERQGVHGVVQRAVAYYLEDAPLLVEKMRNAVERPDPDALQRSAHSLKSASANIGAARLAKFCQEIERLGAAGNLDGGAALVADATAELERVRRVLENLAGKGNV